MLLLRILLLTVLILLCLNMEVAVLDNLGQNLGVDVWHWDHFVCTHLCVHGTGNGQVFSQACFSTCSN
jgi:hypothetical protein